MSADLPTPTILPASTTIAASRMTRRLASMVISQAMSAMTRSTGCTGAPDRPLFRLRGESRIAALPHISQIVGDLELDENVLVGGILAQHGAVADALGDDQHVAGMHDLDAHLGLPFERALD